MSTARKMSAKVQPAARTRPDINKVGIERLFPRFTTAQRWEHAILVISFTMLLLTGLPQKYFESWGHLILTNPQTLLLFRQVHKIFAVILTLEAIYHVGRAIVLISRRMLPASIFPTVQDLRDAWQMTKYLLFISNTKPKYQKYNFEQKFTYWFLFFGIGIMIGTGFVVWFPLLWTRWFPGGIIPAALLAHSSEAIAAGIFIVIWHIYHVHVERLNLSIFTGRLTEREMLEYHSLEYERVTGQPAGPEATDGEVVQGEAQ